MRLVIVVSVGAKWKWTCSWIQFDLLQQTSSSTFEVFKCEWCC